jgi:magnesium transporter
LEEEVAAEIAARLAPQDLAAIVDEMEPDEAADLLGDIPPDQASAVLAAMDEAEEVRPLIEYADDTAGGMMTSAPFVLHRGMSAADAIDYLRSVAPDSEDFYYLYVVDDQMHLVGVVSLRQLIVAPPTTTLDQILDRDVFQVAADADQEEAARLMARYDLMALPVVDHAGRLVGRITHDDLVRVLQQEATEDIYRLGGVAEEHPPDVPFPKAMRSRLPWLVVNLGTAMVSAAILSLFEGTIAGIAALAAFFPIVAGVSGSAGTQTLTVTVRGLALGDIDPRHGLRTLSREFLIGAVNGLTVGLLVAIIALVWKGTATLGIVVGLSTLLTLVGAAIAGVLVPLGMQVSKVDPALASPILVTTITDALGYFIYLGLATLILLPLI